MWARPLPTDNTFSYVCGRAACGILRVCGPMDQRRRKREKFRPPGQFVALVGCYTKARPAGVGCYTAAAAASSPRCDGPLLSAVTQQRLRAPALGGTARCCRVLHLKMPLSFHGAKARTAIFHADILQSVVLRLRTTHRKLSLSDSTACAFAPPQKRPRSVGP